MIDQEIQDALKVDPSPEFLARVRTRIANEPAPSAWRWSWTVAAGAVAASVVVAIVLSPVREKSIVAPVTQTAAAGPKAPALQPAAEELAPVAQSAERRPAPRMVIATALAVQQPEILLDPAETRALQRFIAGARNGRVDLAAVQQSTSPAPMELEPVADIVIAPITIEPLAPLAGAEGVRP
jgi:hypothetical protein